LREFLNFCDKHYLKNLVHIKVVTANLTRSKVRVTSFQTAGHFCKTDNFQNQHYQRQTREKILNSVGTKAFAQLSIILLPHSGQPALLPIEQKLYKLSALQKYPNASLGY
jgi:hypothetical protein